MGGKRLSTRLCIKILTTLLETQVESKCSEDLVAILYDGYHFILTHSQPISASAAHVYNTALAFTPNNTLLFRTYEHELQNSVRVLPWRWQVLVVLFERYAQFRRRCQRTGLFSR